MAQQLGCGDWLGIGGRDLDLLQVRVNVILKIKLTFVSQLHNCRRGKKFADGSNAKDGALRGNGFGPFQIDKSVPFGEEDGSVLHKDEDCPGNVLFLHFLGEEFVEELFQLFGVSRAMAPGRILFVASQRKGDTAQDESDTNAYPPVPK